MNAITGTWSTKSGRMNSHVSARATALIQLAHDGAEETKISFGDLNSRILAVACHLATRFPPKSPILVSAPSHLGLLEGFLGSVAAGMVAVPVPFPSGGDETGGFDVSLAGKKPVAALTDAPPSVEKMSRFSLGCPVVCSSTLADAGDWAPVGRPEPNDYVYVAHGAGTAPAAEPVWVTCRELQENLARIERDWDLHSPQITVACLSNAHPAGVALAFLLPLSRSEKVISIDAAALEQNPAVWLEAISRYRGTIAAAPAFAYEFCARRVGATVRQRLDLGSLTCCLSSERVPTEILRTFFETFAESGLRAEALRPDHVLDSFACSPAMALSELSGDADAASVVASDSVRKGASEDESTLIRLEKLAARALHFRGDERPDRHTPLVMQGMDSRQAVEFAELIRAELGLTIRLETLVAAGVAEGMSLVQIAALPLGAIQDTPVNEVGGGDDEPFPLTDLQKAYLVGRGQDLILGGVSCHAYLEFECPNLDVGRLQTAWEVLIQRHDMLRSTILADGTQRIVPSVSGFSVDVVDTRTLSDAEAECVLATRREALSHLVMAADQPPLLRVGVTHLANGRAVVHLNFDLLVGDFASYRILSDELQLLYRDSSPALPEIRSSFREHALRAESAKRTVEYRRVLEDWRARNESIPAPPELPFARRFELGEAPRFKRREAILPQDEWQRIESRARTYGISASALLLSVYCSVLSRWSSNPEFHVTITLFQRPPEASGVVGDFTTVAPIMPGPLGDTSFLEYAQEVQRQVFRGLDSRIVGGVRIQRELARHGSRLPSVVFSSFLGLGNARIFGWLGQLRYMATQTPQVCIDHQVGECPEGLLLSWDAVDELFPPGLLDDFVWCQLHALRGIAELDWSKPLPPSIPERQLETRGRVNQTRKALPICLLQQLFERQVEKRGSAPAVIAEGRAVGYAELEDLANRLGRWLREVGARRGEPVAVALPKGWEQALAVLGVLKAGAAYLPLDPDLPEYRRFTILEKAQADIVISTDAILADRRWPDASARVSVDHLMARAGGALSPVQGPSDLAYVIFTSGSTGTPKGVMIDHRGACNTILDLNARHAMGSSDRVLGLSALNFDLSVFDMFGLWAVGGAVVLPNPRHARDPAHWRDLLQTHSVTLWNTVPALMEMLVEDLEGRKERLPSSLRAVFLSGDWIPVTLPGRIRQLSENVELISMGGATEASIWSVHYHIGDVPATWKSIPYGFPMVNQTIHVLDAQMAPAPEWVPGRLYIGGDGVALGYCKDAAQTAQRFVDHPHLGRLYWTGDLGRYLADGCVEFLGREDFQVKVQGYRIELEEIESAMLCMDAIQAAVATIADSPRGGKLLVGYFVRRAGYSRLENAEVKAFLTARLPEYMVPNAFMQLDQLPLGANGKVDRKRLHAITAHRESSIPPKPTAGVQALLLRLWTDLLRIESPRANEGFFELGGDSLAATKLVSMVRRETGAELSIAEIFEHPGLEDMANLIESKSRVAQDAGPVRTKSTEKVAQRPQDRYLPFYMTDVQSAYWLGRTDAFELGNVACQGFFELEADDLDVDRLEAAWLKLVERHDQLRIRVRRDGQQEVSPFDGTYRFERVDCSAMPPSQQEGFLDRLRSQRSHMVLDPYKHHMFSFVVVHLGGTKYRLLSNLDLLVADYWSFKVMSEEWKVLYLNPKALLPKLELTFRDYLLSSREQEDPQGFETDMKYWRSKLATLPEAPRLPQKTPTGQIKQPRFGRHQARLPAGPWTALKRAAQKEGMTPSVLVLAAFSECLARHCDHPEFTLNLTLFNRRPIHSQVNQIMGDFTAVSLLEIRRDWKQPFAEWGRAIQKRLWEDLCHRRATGVHVLRELATLKKAGRRALMPVVFTSTLSQEVEPGDGLMGWLGREIYAVSQTPQVLLDHQVMEDAQGLFLLWDVVEDAYPDGLIAKMFRDYVAILEDLARSETLPILPNPSQVDASNAPVVVVGPHGRACRPWETGVLHLPLPKDQQGVAHGVSAWTDPVSGMAFVPTDLTVRATPSGSWIPVSRAHSSKGGGASHPDTKSLPVGEIKDPEAKLRFKLDEKAVRSDLRGATTQLPALASPAVDLMQRLSRRSYRRFLGTELSLSTISEVLSPLSQARIPNVPFPKMLYGSAGGLYPVQTYMYVKPGRVAGLEVGSYWYNPRAHQLVQIRTGEILDRAAHQGPNRGIFEQCGFQIFLVADRFAIEPLYSDWWRDFCLVEAGAICQLLETRGPEWNVGLVQIGGFELSPLRDAFELGAQHVLLQALGGGPIDPHEKTQEALVRESAPIAPIAFQYLRESGRTPDVAVAAPGLQTQSRAPVVLPPAVSGAEDTTRRRAPADDRVAASEPKISPQPAAPAPTATKAGVADANASPARALADDVEVQMHELWQEILGHADFGNTDNFFEAGGNSLLAVRLANGIRAKWGLDLNIVSIFEQPTITALVGLVQQLAPEPALAEVSAAEIIPSGTSLRDRMLAARQVS